ncbi:hypothetical protein CMV_029447, partial [Castanea mollissima]
REDKRKRERSSPGFQRSGQIVAVDADSTLRPHRCCGCREDRCYDVDFDAPTRSKNEYGSNDEKNKRVVELFDVWSKIDTDYLSAWVGVKGLHVPYRADHKGSLKFLAPTRIVVSF